MSKEENDILPNKNKINKLCKNENENKNINVEKSNEIELENLKKSNSQSSKKSQEENIIQEVVILSRGKRCLVFILFFIMNITINLDNGTVPALIDQISNELSVSKDYIGLFGSLQYGGNLLGKHF